MFTILQRATTVIAIFCLLNIANIQTMHLACINGDTETVRALIEENDPVNIKVTFINEKGLLQAVPTPLHYASGKDNLNIIAHLLDAKADIHSTHCDFENTPLHVSVWHNKPDATQMLIQRGAQCDKTNSLGSTPVHIAAVLNHLQCLKELLNSGDLIFNYKLCTTKNNDGNTALDLAVKADNTECEIILRKIINDYIALYPQEKRS